MATQLSVGQVLSLSPDQRAQFVKRNLNTEDGTLGIENITGWEDLSKADMSLLAQQLLPAVRRATAPSVDAGRLAALLAQIPCDREHHATTHDPSPSRSLTVEPPEAEAQEYETKCYQALLDGGCRPLFHISLLAQVETNPDEYRDLLRPWMRYPNMSDSEDWQVFSRQRDRWTEFRTWQLHNRKQTMSFSQYLDERRHDFQMKGGVAGPGFEQVTRRLWEREYGRDQPQLDVEDEGFEAVFSRYSDDTRKLLMDHGFLQPFQLLADPKQQDQWTTYVEYLAYEYSSLHRLNMTTQKLQEKARDYAQKYQTAKAKADHQQRRVDWVRSEISKIEAEQKAAGKGGSISGTTRSRKRKLADDTDGVDVVKPRFVKRRRADETEKITAGWSDNSRTTRSKKRNLAADEDVREPQLKAERKVAGKSDNPRATRCKKRKLSTDEDAPKAQLERKKMAGKSDGPGTRSGKRRKGIDEGNGSAAPGRVLQPDSEAAVVVSAVTTHSRPGRRSKRILRGTAALCSREERLEPLRPGADGKVASVRRGLKTRDGGAATRLGGQPRSTGSISQLT
ncbi:MAG: hypothetical protein Q9207_004735 [Kuettlingeria erythrocarpa]